MARSIRVFTLHAPTLHMPMPEMLALVRTVLDQYQPNRPASQRVGQVKVTPLGGQSQVKITHRKSQVFIKNRSEAQKVASQLLWLSVRARVVTAFRFMLN